MESLHEYCARAAARYMENHINVFIREPGRYVSPAEREWWQRLAGNLRKAQHANPHISNRQGEGTES